MDKALSTAVVSVDYCNSIDYQILYELPLVAMTTVTSGTLPSVAPVKAALYKGQCNIILIILSLSVYPLIEISEHTLYHKLLSLPKSTVCLLWYRYDLMMSRDPVMLIIYTCRCTQLLSNLSPWQLPLLLRLMNLLQFILKEAGIRWALYRMI